MDKEIEVHITSKCNYDCIFCSVNKHPLPEPSKKEILRDISLTSDFNTIIFTGGEPLLREDLLDLVKYAGTIHNKILIETHGYNLSKGNIRRLIKSGVTEIKLSCHANDEITYEKITKKKESFNTTIKALKNLESFSDIIEVGTNTVITRYNAPKLAPIIKWINGSFPTLKKIRVSYPRFYPYANYVDYCKDNIISLPYIKKELDKVMKLRIRKVFFENIPLCIANLPTPALFNWDLYLMLNGKISKGFDKRYFPTRCKVCIKKTNCQGLHQFYSLYFPMSFIKPFTR